MSTWRELKYYVEEVDDAYKKNDKKRFYELLKYSNKQTFTGCEALTNEFINLVAKGIRRFRK